MKEESLPTADDKIVCQIDNENVHSIQMHISKKYPDEWTLDRYKKEFPDYPLLSPYAEAVLKKKRKEGAKKNDVSVSEPNESGVSNRPFHEVFDLGSAPAALSSQGKPISITVMKRRDEEDRNYLPDIDPHYVFSIDLLKKVIVGFQLNKPVYLWGFHGTGKTTVLQQAAARTGRPFMRVQHSLNMQESDVLGQWTVRDGSTEFQLGPLPMAMINGWVYCADEYDTAMPNVTTVYQPVLEGQALIIKDAPSKWRRIVPHSDFRFVATGNTNGIGDETGLYQGTIMQNAANYSRFAITEEVKYMDPDIEVNILQSKAGLRKPDATKIVKFGNKVRDQFADGKISMTVSPRELISAAEIGVAYGGDWSLGLELAFANRLSRVDRQVVKELLQRIFGS